jgi:RimJ/RimL family protein N-acetyltransferase
MAQYFLTTPRLGFRTWAPDDLPLARALWTSPDVMRYMGGPLSEEKLQARFAAEMECQRAHGYQYWPIFLLADDQYIGVCGMRADSPQPETPAFGYHLLPPFWGQGLAHEAARAAVEHAFGQLGVTQLFAGHHPENAGSERVLAKLGFHFWREILYPPTGLMHRGYLLQRQVST